MVRTRPRREPIVTFEDVLQHPTRAAIVKSILSRENASTIREILNDVNTSYYTVKYHLHILEGREILAKDIHPTTSQPMNHHPEHAGKTYQYYISPAHEELQDTLRNLFPVEYAM